MESDQEKRLTAFLSLRQRYHWSVAVFEPFKPLLEREMQGQALSDEETRRATALASFWFASLWVLVEGWQQLGLSHRDVDPFLRDPRIDVLRRFRNFVFHFQEDYESAKQRDLLAEQGAVVAWVLELATALNTVLMPHYYELDTKRIAQRILTGDGDLSNGAV